MSSRRRRSRSGDEQTSHSRRHSAEQIQQLEEFFKENPHPNESQRLQWSRILGLEPHQIKFWFQNKRNQIKSKHEKTDNSILKSENEKLRSENLAMKETMSNFMCPNCDRQCARDEEGQLNLQKLKMENALLKEEKRRRVNSLTQIPSSQNPTPLMTVHGEQTSQNITSSVSQVNERKEMDMSSVIEIAVAAIDELKQLVQVQEPLWFKSPIDGRYYIHRDNYNKFFQKENNSKAWIESSKDSREMAMDAKNLIEMLRDSNKWKDMFPTIVNDARTIEVLNSESLDGPLYFMYQKMHVLSPFVAPREFFLLRHFQQLNSNMWIMAEVSYDFFKELEDTSSPPCWKFPSGCIIEEMANGKSIVTWLEHVQLHDKSLTKSLYGDLIFNSQAYGAKRWIASLQRMSERVALISDLELAQAKGTKQLVELSQRMIKDFTELLSMLTSSKNILEIPQRNNNGVRISSRRSDGLGQPNGLIISGATSLWLPVSQENLFNFLKDNQRRAEWDVLTWGHPVSEITRISTGSHPGDYVSIIEMQPYGPNGSKFMVLQETSIDSLGLGANIIYTPVELQSIISALNGEDTVAIPILPSGFTISTDGRFYDTRFEASSSSNVISNPSTGSLLTMTLQRLYDGNAPTEQQEMESMASVNALIIGMVEKIKVALGCSGLD